MHVSTQTDSVEVCDTTTQLTQDPVVTSARRLCFRRIYLFIYLSVCQQDCAKT